MLDQITQRLLDNLDRVDNLLAIYNQYLKGSGAGRRTVGKTDVLRAAVVLLHATLEDFLRSLAAWKLPDARPEDLEGIPIVGTGRKGQPDKFTIRQLVERRGTAVNDLITESISIHLEEISYSNTDQVVAQLQRIRLNIEPLQRHLGDLPSLINRRHQIVHRADKNEQPGQGHFSARSISTDNIVSWTATVREFSAEVIHQLRSAG
jgi:hypothetical protein